MVKFKHLGKTVTNQNYIYEKIKSRTNSSTISLSVASSFLCNILKIKIYRTITLPLFGIGMKIALWH
jgi:hypothetical protein